MFGAHPAPRLARAETPGEALDNAARLGDLVGRALREVLAPEDLPRAEEHDVVGGGLELLFVSSGVVLALADVKDVLLVLGALGCVSSLRLLLAGIRQRRFAGGVLGN